MIIISFIIMTETGGYRTTSNTCGLQRISNIGSNQRHAYNSTTRTVKIEFQTQKEMEPRSPFKMMKEVSQKVGEIEEKYLEKDIPISPFKPNKEKEDEEATLSGEKARFRSISGITESPKTGDRIKVYWPNDKKFFEGEVVSKSQKRSGGTHTILYDDGKTVSENLTGKGTNQEDVLWDYVEKESSLSED